METEYRTFNAACRDISSGDLVLFRRRGVIAALGRGIHSHVGMVAWWSETLMCLELRVGGGRAVSLEGLVARLPGRLDVFEVNPYRSVRFNRMRAVGRMRRLISRDYGYRRVAVAALYHVPVIRLLMRPGLDDRTVSSGPLSCSHAVSDALRVGGGVDPVPFLADRFVEPADLARSFFCRYRFTLMP